MSDTENNDFKGFDEDDAVAFIRADIPENISDQYSDDEILFVIDSIWDYYENRGLTSLDDIDIEEDLLDVDDLTD